MVAAWVNLTTSSIFSNKFIIGSRIDYSCYILCLFSSMSMVKIFPWSSYRCWMRLESVWLLDIALRIGDGDKMIA